MWHPGDPGTRTATTNPVGSRSARGGSEPRTRAALRTSRHAPRRSPSAQRTAASGGRARRETASRRHRWREPRPADTSRRRSKASNPTSIAPIAKTSQFWNANNSTGEASAQRHARDPHRRSSATVIQTHTAVEASAVTTRTPIGLGAIDAAIYNRIPAPTGYSSTRSTIREPARSDVPVQEDARQVTEGVSAAVAERDQLEHEPCAEHREGGEPPSPSGTDGASRSQPV